jgi:hypothetical protein
VHEEKMKRGASVSKRRTRKLKESSKKDGLFVPILMDTSLRRRAWTFAAQLTETVTQTTKAISVPFLGTGRSAGRRTAAASGGFFS